jgi:hypothetical protein
VNETQKITCPKCGLLTEAVMPDELDRLVSLCCWSTIPGSEKTKCATPSCQNQIAQSKEVFCQTCQARQRNHNPEAVA